jgi:drug/metabolite transporter (DMT)-like permease
MTNIALYGIIVFAWSTSWLAIKGQLGVVAPEVSVAYRFGLAAAIMLVICIAGRRRMRFGLRDHAYMMLQGMLLFSTNFYLAYLGSQYLTSGQVAVAFSTLVVMNMIGAAIFFGAAVTARMTLGAGLGIGGLALVFWPEIVAFDLSRVGTLGLMLTLAGTLFASLGMMTSARNQRNGLPVIQANTYGMLYGTVFMTLVALALGKSFDFEMSVIYVGSLAYLAVVASVVGFWSFLTLQGRIGAGRTAYAAVLFPVIALMLSTVFEGFQWTPAAVGGIALVLLGNILVLATGPLFKGRRAKAVASEAR